MKFSEEQLVDCDKSDSGCLGGDMGMAFDWIKDNGGVCKEDDYPYAGFWPPIKTCATTCDVVEGTEVIITMMACCSLSFFVIQGEVVICFLEYCAMIVEYSGK